MAVPEGKAGLGANLIAGQEELIVCFCQPCMQEAKQLPAEGYCVNCKEYLCGTCYKYHRQPSVTKHHVLLDRNQMPKDELPTASNVKDVCNDLCVKHSGKLVEYFCKHHNNLGCSVCMTVYHRGCAGVSYIPDIVEGIDKSKSFINLKEKFNEIQQNVEQFECKAKENCQIVEANNNQVIAEIRHFRDEINDLFDTLENEMCQKAKVIRDEDLAAMNSVYDECNSVKSTITTMDSDLDKKQSAGQNCQAFAAVKKAENRIKSIEKKVSKINNDCKVRRLKFEAEKQIRNFISNLQSLGSLTKKYVSINIPGKLPAGKPALIIGQDNTKPDTTSAISMDRESMPTETKPNLVLPKPRVAEHAKCIYARSESDKKSPCITGIALLSDGRLALADFNNESIKIIDKKTKKITVHETQQLPWDLTEVNKDQVVATCGNKIIFLSVSSTPYESGEISVVGESRGIAYHQGKLIVSFLSPSKVEVMTKNGKVLKRFNTSYLFKCPYYVAISKDGNMIYVSDMLMLNGQVLSLSQDGQVKEVFNLKHATGLALDKYGSVFVCQFGMKMVHQLSQDLNKVQQLLGAKDKVPSPYAITYCDKEDKLYVGMDNNANIQVFQFK